MEIQVKHTHTKTLGNTSKTVLREKYSCKHLHLKEKSWLYHLAFYLKTLGKKEQTDSNQSEKKRE